MRIKHGAVWGMLLASVLLAGCEPEADRDASGSIVTEGAVDAFNMKVGDCFDDQASEQIFDVPGRPCSEPHDNEVFALFDAVLDEYPGSEEMTRYGAEKCIARFEAFVGRDYESSALDVFPITPTSQSWDLQNDREVICALFRVDLGKMTGSMRGSGI
jgi:hypothetical protein